MAIDRNDRIADLVECDDIDVAVMELWDTRSGCACQPWKTVSLVVIVPPTIHKAHGKLFMQKNL